MAAVQLLPEEEALLCNFEDVLNISNASLYINELWKGNWEFLLQGDLFLKVLHNYKRDDIKIKLEDCNQEELLCTGIASLLLFVQCNFSGPNISKNVTDYLDLHGSSGEEYQKDLAIDAEEIDVNAKHAELLIVAQCIFENCELNNKYIVSWWCLRSVITYQHLLDECCATLFTKIENKITDLLNWDICKKLKAKLYLELAQFYLLYNRTNDSEKCLNDAKVCLGINFELSGELGKRTKFQERNIAQIMLCITFNEERTSPAEEDENLVPETVKLDDEVRLDAIEYATNYKIPMLSAVEQNTLLNTVQFMQRARPKDELLREESQAFIVSLLAQKNNWSIRFVTLLLRCILESNHKRTIERSLSQCELLMIELNRETPVALKRLNNAWSVGLHSLWKIRALLAGTMFHLGLVKGSLEMYLSMQMWEEVIVCYNVLEMRNRAAEVIKEQIAKNSTVKLWCLLGDAIDDISCYEKAWNLSLHKSSRAKRHWGQYLFARKEYKDCIPHLQQSLEINSLQSMVWLRLGFAALETEDWELAAHAYRRYTYLEPGEFEAWNNLAKSYIKLGEKTRAHYALQEALKYSFSNWKVWDNFMVVSAAIGQLNDVIRSYHQILDLKEKHLDKEVLFLLTRDVLLHEEDTEEQNIKKKLIHNTRVLFGRLTSIYPNESRLWEMYADLSPLERKPGQLCRAYRGFSRSDWPKDPEKCGQVLDLCKRLSDATIAANNPSNITPTRLTLNSVIAAAKKQNWEQHTELVTELEGFLDIINKL